MNRIIEELFSWILGVLKEQEYCISEQTFEHIKVLSKQKRFYYSKDNSTEVIIPAEDYFGRKFGNIKLINISQTVDIPPVLLGNSLIDIVPVVLIRETTSPRINWTIIHEIVHLLSIGPYIQLENGYYHHHFGMNEYLYTIQDGQLVQIQQKQHNDVNELITDLITWHLLRKRYINISALYDGLKNFGEYVKAQSNSSHTFFNLVNWYFTGNSAAIDRFLLGSSYSDYGQLFADKILTNRK